MLERLESYETQGIGYAFIGGVSERVNGFLGKEVTDNQMYRGQLNVFPDLVTASESEERLGCLLGCISVMPRPVKQLLAPIIWTVRAIDSLIGLMIILVVGLVAMAVILMFWFVFVPAGLLLLVVFWLLELWQRQRLAKIAARIRENPNGPYAVRKLHKLSPPYPRVWQRGEIVQLIRTDVRLGLLKTRSLVFLVMHQPHPSGSDGIFLFRGLVLIVSRWLNPQRRLYVLSMHKQEHADQAASAISHALGLPITAAKFSFGRLKIQHPEA